MLQPIPLALSIINIFILPITTTMAEDGLYLGIGVNQIKNKYIATLFPAFFYALQHSFIPFLLDTKFIIYRFISFFPLTIIFCVYYYRKRDPLPIMIGHFIINIATVIQIFIISMFPTLYESMV
jgi:membrane protease YdiL (CAAX protease family)